MKKIYLILIIFITCSFATLTTSAQGIWTQMNSFPGLPRYDAAGFASGEYVFVGIGRNSTTWFNDFYKFDQTTSDWYSIAAYPGAGSEGTVGVAIGPNAYVGLGRNSSLAVQNDWWGYDTISNTWSALATCPGTPRYDASYFTLGHKIYVIGGSTGAAPFLNDVWVYDSHQNTWAQLNNSPAGYVDGMVAFVIGNHGYIGGGWDGTTAHNACWQYDTTNDTWAAVAGLPIAIAGNPKAFVLCGEAYVTSGVNAAVHDIQDGYMYDTLTKVWSVFTNLGTNGIESSYATAASIGNNGYITAGMDSLGNSLSSYYQFLDTSNTTITITPPIPTICQGSTIALTANGASNYIWTPSTGLNTSLGSSVIASPTSTTIYSITTSAGCSNSFQVVVNVNPSPVLVAIVSPPQICSGGNTTLTVYDSSVTKELADTDVQNALLNSNAPTTNYQGFPDFFCLNWTVQGIDAVARSIVSYNLSSIPPGDTITKAILSLYGDSTPTQHEASYSTTSNASWLQLITSPWNPATVTWNTQPDTTGLDELTVPKTSADSIFEDYPDIDVTRLISDLYNNPSTYYGLMLRLKDETVIYNCLLFGSNTNSDTHCRPKLAISYASKSKQAGKISYTWAPSTGLSATTGSSVIASPTATTTYTVYGTTNFGCMDSIKVVVTVGDTLPVLNVSLPSPQICNGEAISIVASGANQYQWSPSAGLNTTTGDSIIANPTVNTTYTIIGSNGAGCMDTAQSIITIIPAPPIIINPLTPVVCSYQSVLLTAPVSGSNYQWSPASGLSATTGDSIIATPTANVTYTVTGTDSLGCTATGNDAINIIPAPNIPTITVSVTGDSLISSAKSDNQWYFDDQLIPDSTRQVLVIKGHARGWYTVTVTNEANGCSTTSDSTTAVDQLSVINEQLLVYPNPTNNVIFIKVRTSVSNVGDWSLQLADVLGRTLYIAPSLSYSNEIDLSGLPSGVYFITVVNKTDRGVFEVVKE